MVLPESNTFMSDGRKVSAPRGKQGQPFVRWASPGYCGLGHSVRFRAYRQFPMTTGASCNGFDKQS
jgi:hypothetical protein